MLPIASRNLDVVQRARCPQLFTPALTNRAPSSEPSGLQGNAPFKARGAGPMKQNCSSTCSNKFGGTSVTSERNRLQMHEQRACSSSNAFWPKSFSCTTVGQGAAAFPVSKQEWLYYHHTPHDRQCLCHGKCIVCPTHPLHPSCQRTTAAWLKKRT